MSINIAKEWLHSAKLDLDSIEYIINDENLTSIVAFHSQQAVEKSLKSFFELYEIKVPKKHDLIALYKLAKEKNKNLNIDEDILDKLTELYIDSRYPGELGLLPNGKPSIDDSKEFFEFAKRSYEIIKSHVESINKTR